MLIKNRHVKNLGYVGTNIFQTSCHSVYKKEFPKQKTFVLISNYFPQNIEIFKMTDDEYRKYKKGKIGMTPYGCCNATGKESIHGKVVWNGEFKSYKVFKNVVNAVESLVET